MALSRARAVTFVGSTSSLDELYSYEVHHYSRTSYEELWIPERSNELEDAGPALERRAFNTTIDVGERWRLLLMHVAGGPDREPSDYAAKQLDQAAIQLAGRRRGIELAEELIDIPDRLEGRAFLWKVAEELRVTPAGSTPASAKAFEHALASMWITSHLDEYGGPIISHALHLGIVDCGLLTSQPSQCIDLRQVGSSLHHIGVLEALYSVDIEELALFASSLSGAILSGIVSLISEASPSELLAIRHRLQTWRRSSRGSNSAMELLEYTAVELPDYLLAESLPADHRGRSPQHVTGLNDSSALPSSSSTKMIFIGHGRSPEWLKLKDFLVERLGLDYLEFTREPVAGATTTNRLESLLDQASFALLIMTAEDETAERTMRARENVVHEIGLFQGRLGFDRAIVLVEEGCEQFSNIDGLGQLRFPVGNIGAVFEKVRELLEHRL